MSAGTSDPRIEVRVLDGPLSPTPPAWALESAGAQLSFQGVVRPLEDGRPIRGIRYETYDPMATRMLEALATRVLDSFGLHAIRVLHSRGFVGVGACSFQLDVASPHRRESIDAMDRFITQMKEEVPIWKHPENEGAAGAERVAGSDGAAGATSVQEPAGSDEAAGVEEAEGSAGRGGLADPEIALRELLERLAPVDTERIALAEAVDRILAAPVEADRDSPPADVSAMDGFALRTDDLSTEWIPVREEAEIGEAVRELPPGAAMKIFTGGPVPRGAELVIRREDVEERPAGTGGSEEAIRLRIDPEQCRAGQAIRRRAENIRAGERVLEAGLRVRAPVLGALGAFGAVRPEVHRRVRVAILVTGNEIVPVHEVPGPTAIRDSNGWALDALLSPRWIERVSRERVVDDPEQVGEALAGALSRADAVVLTGGVSMGDHDYVPGAIEAQGGTIHFHRLAIKPGKPVLGATGPDGQLVMGLPGNPVSVLATARKFLLPALRRLGGLGPADDHVPELRLADPLPDPHRLTRYLPVEWVGPGRGRVISSRGSGDLVAAARSVGLVEIPPGGVGQGPYPFLSWD